MKHFLYLYLALGIIGFFLLKTSLMEKILILGLIAIVSLILTVIEDEFFKKFKSKFNTILVGLFPIGVISVFLVFFAEHKWVIYISTSIWFLISLLIVIYSIKRMTLMKKFNLNEVVISLGLFLHLPASILFALYSFDIEWSLFKEGVLLLTVVHFYFFITVLPVLMGMLGRIIDKGKPVYYVYLAVLVLLVVSILLYIIDLFIDGSLSIPYSIVLGISLFLYLLIILFYVLPYHRKWSVILLSISQSSILYTMTLPLIDTYMKHLGAITIFNPDIIVLHGLINAVVFVMLGLFSWVYISNSPRYGISEKLFEIISEKDIKMLKKAVKDKLK